MLKITLSPAQQEIVGIQTDQMLIRGIPGSGKTTVLLKKIEAIIGREPSAKVLIITYNKTLTKYIQDFMKNQNITSERMSVSTFHSWAYGAVRKIGGKSLSAVNSRQEQAEIKKAADSLAGTGHSFFKSDKYYNFLKEEMSWLKGAGIDSKEEYLKAKRAGRGTALKKEDREAVFNFVGRFNESIRKQKIYQYDDYALEAYKLIDDIKKAYGYEYVLIDEGQDLTQMQLIILRSLPLKELVVAADLGQKIYKTDFTWRSVGIRVQGGRTKTLKKSHRTSAEIMSLAKSLQAHDPLLITDEDEIASSELPDRVTDELPELISYSNPEKEFEGIVKIVEKIWRDSDKDITIGILLRHRKWQFSLKNKLDGILPVSIINQAEGSVLTPGVKIITMHSAKGLEFDVVLLARLTDKYIPGVKSEFDEEEWESHVATERRLVYVSMTRAKHKLIMTSYGTKSRFLSEMDKDLFIER